MSEGGHDYLVTTISCYLVGADMLLPAFLFQTGICHDWNVSRPNWPILPSLDKFPFSSTLAMSLCWNSLWGWNLDLLYQFLSIHHRRLSGEQTFKKVVL